MPRRSRGKDPQALGSADGSESPLHIYPGDRFGLAVGVLLTPAGLCDTLRGHEFRLNVTGLEILRRLDEGKSFGAVTAEIHDAYGIERAVVWQDACALICELDAHALLSLRPSWTERIGDLPRRFFEPSSPATVLAQLIFGWTRVSSFSGRRFRASVSGLLAACLRAHWWLYGGFLALSLGFVLTLYHLGPPPTSVPWWRALGFAMIKPAFLSAVFLLLMLIHEGAHLCTLRLLRPSADFVVVRGWTVAIAHEYAGRRKEAAVGAAGPMAAFASSLLLALLAGIFLSGPLGFSSVDTQFPAILGAIHLLGLGPWMSDGQAIWSLWASDG